VSHAANSVAWNTVAGDPLDADGPHYELFFGYRDEAAFAAQVEQLVADRFAIRLAAKDLDLALAGASRGGAESAGELPVAEAAGTRLRAAIAGGAGEDDIARLIAEGNDS
jgi:hypothetical protein